MAAMLAPETLIFEPKQMTEKKGKLSNAKSCISDKGFFSFHPNDHHEPVVIQNMKIVVLTPSGLDEASNQLRLSLTNDTEYYKVTGIKSIASLLFSRDFFKTFLLQGELFIQSFLEDHRRDDFMIIKPNGELMICVDHPTSERLGFNGAKKFICENGRVLIVVNLKNSLFSNDEISSKALNKFRTSLASIEHLFVEPFSIAWEPHDTKVCPSTIAKFFYDNGSKVDEIEPTVSFRNKKLFHHQSPNLFNVNSETSMITDETELDFDAVEDWMGSLLFDLPKSRLQELAEISSIQQDDSSSGQDNEESVTIIQANGIFLSSSFKRILNALQQNSAAEWSVISTNPTAGSLFMMQHSKMKAKIFDLSSRAVVVFRDAVFTRSKRG